MLKLRTEDLEFREIEGEVVALDLKTSSYIGINQTGGTLWPLLQEGTDEGTLVRRLIEEFDVPEPVAQRDVKAFIEGLRERGLLTETP
jgi:hypothetical protein